MMTRVSLSLSQQILLKFDRFLFIYHLNIFFFESLIMITNTHICPSIISFHSFLWVPSSCVSRMFFYISCMNAKFFVSFYTYTRNNELRLIHNNVLFRFGDTFFIICGNCIVIVKKNDNPSYELLMWFDHEIRVLIFFSLK